jgi:hypothetical protein
MSLWGSRKFKLTIAACLFAIGNAIVGTVTWQQALWACVVAIATNIFGIAIEDHGLKSRGNSPPPQ